MNKTIPRGQPNQYNLEQPLNVTSSSNLQLMPSFPRSKILVKLLAKYKDSDQR